jgi:hypothetical protein
MKMTTLNARVAIYCDVEIKVDDNFDFKNYDADELIDKALENAPEPYDYHLGRVVEPDGYEVLSIWDEDLTTCFYAG